MKNWEYRLRSVRVKDIQENDIFTRNFYNGAEREKKQISKNSSRVSDK